MVKIYSCHEWNRANFYLYWNGKISSFKVSFELSKFQRFFFALKKSGFLKEVMCRVLHMARCTNVATFGILPLHSGVGRGSEAEDVNFVK
jgi:hypothetical protein